MNEFCTCAVCLGIKPWTDHFPECMVTRAVKTSRAVVEGEAMSVEGHVWWWPWDEPVILVEELDAL